jgi:hypothetical protein
MISLLTGVRKLMKISGFLKRKSNRYQMTKVFLKLFNFTTKLEIKAHVNIKNAFKYYFIASQ